MKNQLTPIEKREPAFATIGRLRRAIKDRKSVERQLALLEKVAGDMSEMDLKIMRNERLNSSSIIYQK